VESIRSGVIDGLVHGLGRTVVNVGKTVRYMQIGFVRVDAAIILARRDNYRRLLRL